MESTCDINPPRTTKKSTYYLGFFLLLHLICWTLGPYLARPSLPRDTLESITWGLQWQLGYPKHPFLTAWVCAEFFSLFHQADWSMLFLAQLLVSVTLLSVWKLAQQMLPATHALIATLILDGVLFYNINSFNLTPDTFQSPLWALVSLCFYHALTKQKLRYWISTAVFAACAFCTKYQAILLFGPMLFLCCWDPVAQKSLKKSGIYWSIGLFIALITPHLLWLYQHDWITIAYAEHSAKEYTETKTIWGRILYPGLFLINQCLVLVGAIGLLWPFYTSTKTAKLGVNTRPSGPCAKDSGGRETKGSDLQEGWKLSPFQWHFLIILGFGPLALTLGLCAVCGYFFPLRWSTPYYFLLGILLVSAMKPVITAKNLQRFSLSLILFSTLLFMVREINLLWFPKPDNDAFLPNREMAATFSKLWKDRYHVPLAYLVGSNYLISMITPYFKDQPQPFLGWDPSRNPWIKLSDLRKKGALFLWDEAANYGWDEEGRYSYRPPPEVFKNFPQLIVLPHYTFYRLSNQQPVIIGVAVLPPRPDRG